MNSRVKENKCAISDVHANPVRNDSLLRLDNWSTLPGHHFEAGLIRDL